MERDPGGPTDTPAAPRRRLRLAVGVAWAVVAGGWVLHLWATSTTPTASLQSLVDAIDGAWWAVPAFVAVYAVRPLVLAPASVLTVAAGVLFGAVGGVAVVVVAANLSALVAYGVGRTFSPDQVAASGASGLVARWSGRLRERAFTTVLVLRLALLPYDLVTYVSGFLRVPAVPFVAATALGSLPGTAAFVLAGASVDRLDAGVSGLDLRVLVASVAILAVSLPVGVLVQRRTAAAERPPDAAAPPA